MRIIRILCNSMIFFGIFTKFLFALSILNFPVYEYNRFNVNYHREFRGFFSQSIFSLANLRVDYPYRFEVAN